MSDTDPLDLDAVYDRWIDWYNGAPNPDRWRHRDAGESMSHCLAREDVPALIAEVRRLREGATAPTLDEVNAALAEQRAWEERS